MNIRVWRGTHQIGGCVTEITSGNTRIFIDFGRELPGPDGQQQPETLSVPGVTEGSPQCGGIFFTHTHGDHIGQLDRILPGIPLWMGDTSRELCLVLNRYLHGHRIDRTRTIDALERASVFTPGKPATVGALRVTPFFIDHSAFDAYMFLIEGDGTRILHTGDFRNHGFRGKALIPMLERYVRHVDWLITEGTMLSRRNETIKTEQELRIDERELMRKHKRIFVLCSSMNIDRIAGFCSAVPDGRPVLCDQLQKTLLDVVQARHSQKTSLYDFSKVVVYNKRTAVKLNPWIQDKGFLCFIRANSSFARRMLDLFGDDAIIAYSMWAGYLSGPTENTQFTALLAGRPWVYLHTSGHATPDTLREVCETVKPTRGLIPIHTEEPGIFQTLSLPAPVRLLEDGELLEL